MVSGDICEPPAPPEPRPTGRGRSTRGWQIEQARGVLAGAGGSAQTISTMSAPGGHRCADDAAPRANNMAELQQCRTMAADLVRAPVPQQAPCQHEKPNKTGLSRLRPVRRSPAIAARSRQIFPPTGDVRGRIAPGPPACYAEPFRPSQEVRESAHVPAICVASPRHRAVDPGVGFRQTGRRGPRRRCGRRRLDPSRRDGRAFRAQHFLRPRRHQGDAPAHQEDLRRASDDRALRSLSRSLRQSRLRSHHRACRGRSASASLAAGDPRARQEGRRLAQPGHAGRARSNMSST